MDKAYCEIDNCKEEATKVVFYTIGEGTVFDTTYGNVCCEEHIKEMTEGFLKEFGGEPTVANIEE